MEEESTCKRTEGAWPTASYNHQTYWWSHLGTSASPVLRQMQVHKWACVNQVTPAKEPLPAHRVMRNNQLLLFCGTLFCGGLWHYFSTSAPLALQNRWFFVGSGPRQRGAFSSIRGLYPLDARCIPSQSWQSKMSPDIARCPLGAKTQVIQETLILDFFSFKKKIFFFAFFFFFFRAAPVAYGGSQPRGQIEAAAASLYHSHSNTRSLTHCARPRIKPTTS